MPVRLQEPCRPAITRYSEGTITGADVLLTVKTGPGHGGLSSVLKTHLLRGRGSWESHSAWEEMGSERLCLAQNHCTTKQGAGTQLQCMYIALSTAPNHMTLCPNGKPPLIGVSKDPSWLLLRINARNSHIKKDAVSIKRLY